MLKTGQTYRHHHAKHYSPHSFGSLLDVQCWARIFLPQWTKTPRKKQKTFLSIIHTIVRFAYAMLSMMTAPHLLQKHCVVVISGVHVLLVSLFGRPIVRSISHFFGRPIFFLVDQKPISHFFGRPIFFLVNQKPFSHVFGRPIYQIYFWLTKKNEKQTGQLVDQEIDQNHMDGTKMVFG